MKVTTTVNPPQARIWLVDWAGLYPFHRNSPHFSPFKDELQRKAYFAYWFDHYTTKLPCLHVADIYSNNGKTIEFTNGRHRTNVLSQGMRYVPMSAPFDVYRNRLFAPFFIRKIPRGEVIEIPDYPICKIKQEFEKAELVVKNQISPD